MGEVTRHEAARAAADPVLALGRRQVDADAQPRATRTASIRLSISVTTRQKRPSEIDGVHYRFIDEPTSSRRCAIAAISSNGPRCTATSTARRASRSSRPWPRGEDMMFDIDWQGTRQIVEKMRRRRGERLHPAALDGGAEGAARAARRGHARGHRAAPAQRARRDRAVGILRLRARQRRSRPHLRAT